MEREEIGQVKTPCYVIDEKKLEYYRRSVRKRLTLVAVVIIVVVIYGRQIKI